MRHVLPHEAICGHKIHELPALQRDAGGSQHDSVHHVLHRLQPGGFAHVGSILGGPWVHARSVLPLLRSGGEVGREEASGRVLPTKGFPNDRPEKRELQVAGLRRLGRTSHSRFRRRCADWPDLSPATRHDESGSGTSEIRPQGQLHSLQNCGERRSGPGLGESQQGWVQVYESSLADPQDPRGWRQVRVQAWPEGYAGDHVPPRGHALHPLWSYA
mmetsp:Transcript_67861/g.161964  ORF Transcript_67861/g.161964 Transcript_67861/m.161964 type:complete len:216 (-) Transcript_67861:690-1337(-)